MFFSLKNTFNNSMSQKSDVRELVPEFFYLDDLLINRNGLNFGTTQSNMEVNDVDLPEWANSPSHFVFLNRIFLESDKTSKEIHNWFDLIFGFKQKGEAAVEACNLFNVETYGEDMKIEEISERESIEALFSKYEFGQCPQQLLTAAHPSRKNRNDCRDKHSIFKNIDKLQFFKSQTEKMRYIKHGLRDVNNFVILLKNLDSTRVVSVRNNGEVSILQFFDTPYNPSRFTFIRERILELHDKSEMEINHDQIKSLEDTQAISLVGNLLINGCFWSNMISVLNLKTEEKYEVNFQNEGRITCIEQIGDHIVLGNSNGLLMVMFKKDNLELKKSVFTGESPIASICTSEYYQTVIVAKTSGRVLTFSYPNYKLLSWFKLDDKAIDIFVASRPFGCVVVFGQTFISTYTINGKLISKKEIESKTFCRKIIQDEFGNDYLVEI